jgi:hypothetical protein
MYYLVGVGRGRRGKKILRRRKGKERPKDTLFEKKMRTLHNMIDFCNDYTHNLELNINKIYQ